MTEVTKLANDIALQAAAAALDSSTNSVELDGREWHDIDIELCGQPLGIALKKELRYLTLRKALVWHLEKPNLVRVVEVWS